MKKIISLLISLIMVMSVLCVPAFGYSNQNIDKAIETLKAAAKTTFLTNDTSMDEYLEFVRKLVPEKYDVFVDYSPMGNFFSCTNSTDSKEGKLRAQFRFYHVEKKAHPGQYEYESDEYITFKIPKGSVAGEKETASTAPKFTDVASDAYYAEAVKWAVENNVTAGTSATTFSPDVTCTRAQILTFLWRAAGSPSQAIYSNPFTDVDKDDYYYEAAVWAGRKKMVTGDKFEADTPCTRSATVKYLWINAGSAARTPSDKFTDVPKDADYAKAVAWAVSSKITSGPSETTFSPDATCTRGQIVTFLNRAMKSIKKV